MSTEAAGQGPVHRVVRPASEAPTLVERLRTRPTGDPYLHMMVHEAADEIERLRGQATAVGAECGQLRHALAQVGKLAEDRLLQMKADREEFLTIRGRITRAPVAIIDTRDALGLCAPTEADFPALYALQGRRVALVDLGPNTTEVSGAPGEWKDVPVAVLPDAPARSLHQSWYEFKTAKQQGVVAGDGKPCPNDHDPQCGWPNCNCRKWGQ